MMHLVKEFELLAICCIFFVKFSTVSANPTLEGFECTGEKKWKIAKFDKIYCYTRVRAPAAKNEAVISNNYCGQIDRASHPASIHSLAENNFLENTFINGFIGLFQPGYGGYNPGLYRWEDGTPLNFVHWDRGFHLKPQPNNDSPIERLTRLRKNRKFHGWHDWIAKDIDYVICKKPATKIPVATPKATENPSTLAETIATTQISEAPKTQPLKPEELVDPPKKSSQDNSKNVKIIQNTYIIDTDPKHTQTHGGSLLSCNTVKCRGGHKCIMTKDECQIPHKFESFAPKNCESKPKCVPDKICKACGPNERRSRCSICEQSCKDPNREQCKKENICGQNSRCICDFGFVRNKAGKCVNFSKCPNASKTTPTTPEEEFIVISKKEKNERHEQIDLLKSKTTTKNPNGHPGGNGNPNHPGKQHPNGPKSNPDDGFIIVKQNSRKPDRNNPNPNSKPDKKPSNEKPTITDKPNDDGFIIVKGKENKHKPDENNSKPLKPGKNSPNDNKPDKPNDDGFIIVKGKGNPATKQPSDNHPKSPTKPTEAPENGFIVVHEKRKNRREPSGSNNNNNNNDKEFFVSKKKIQNNKHEQINLM